MSHHHATVGALLLVATLLCFSFKYFGATRRGPFRVWGWAGLTILLSCEVLLFRRVPWVATFFTPVVWTGYLLLVDALVGNLSGQSRLSREPRKFLALAFWSVPLWLVFEAYNLRLENWTYVGLPENLLIRAAGYVWSFATIWPAIYETADLIRALGIGRGRARPPSRIAPSSHAGIVLAGLLMLVLPVLLPARVGQYLFGAVWFGFVLLFDPMNYRWNGPSFLRDAESGDVSNLQSFIVSGLVCGILWEFWNYWAKAKWLYVFPILQGWKIFEMPLPGYVGFPAFALECFVMYEFLGTCRNRLEERRRGSAWREAVLGAGPPSRS